MLTIEVLTGIVLQLQCNIDFILVCSIFSCIVVIKHQCVVRIRCCRCCVISRNDICTIRNGFVVNITLSIIGSLRSEIPAYFLILSADNNTYQLEA